MNDTVLIIGGDERQKYLKKYLEDKTTECTHIVTQKDTHLLKNTDAYTTVVLPVPVSRDSQYVFSTDSELHIKLTDIYDIISEKHTVICGGAGEEILKALKSKTQKVYDFMNDEAFVYYNACLTAQGALRLLLENTKEYLPEKRCLVIGYGKVGETLANTLKNQGCEVYVCTRNKLSLMRAKCSGCNIIEYPFIKSCIYLFDYVFGTVPANVLSESEISHIRDEALYFELASPPFTADKKIFERYGKNHIMASVLPGRFTPESAAKAIGDFILTNT